MNGIKKHSKTFKMLLIFMIAILLIALGVNIYATDINSIEEANFEDLESYLSTVPNIEAKEIVELYTELTEKYSNQEIANMIEENKEQIMDKSGITEKDLDTGTSVLRSLDTNETKKILKEDLNIEEIQEKLDKGYTMSQIVNDIQKNMTSSQKISIFFRLLWASSIVRTTLILTIFLTLYTIVVRWTMFKKAGKHGWASIIPIYNVITYLSVSGISPWWILILIIPVFGWLLFGIIQLIARFTLATSFGRGIGFGFGLLFLGIIFESILAFNGNIKYVGDEE